MLSSGGFSAEGEAETLETGRATSGKFISSCLRSRICCLSQSFRLPPRFSRKSPYRAPPVASTRQPTAPECQWYKSHSSSCSLSSFSLPPRPANMSLFGSASATPAATTTTATGDISKDVALNNPPEDGISDLMFSPAGDFLSVASWDGKVRVYSVSEQGASEGKAMIPGEKPVLATAWSSVSARRSPSRAIDS